MDFSVDADDEVTAGLRALFPDGSPGRAEAWREVLG